MGTKPPHPEQLPLLVQRRSTSRCIGREAALAALRRLLDDELPLVMALHGIAGIGKTTVAQAFAAEASAQGVPVVWLEGGAFEPTPAGWLQALAARLPSTAEATVTAVAAALTALAPRVVLLIDGFERCHLVDDWLRREWLPAMGSGVRLLLVGRDVPLAQWRRAPGWGQMFAAEALGPLATDDAVQLLQAEGVAATQVPTLLRRAGGHPLALRLAAGAASREATPEGDEWHAELGTLVSLWLEDIDDRRLRLALRATSVARRITVSLLQALFDGEDAQALFAQLAELPLTHLGPDGLRLDDSVREAIATHFQASDPAAHRAARQAVWTSLQAESRSATPAQLWRYTADMLYLVEQPSVREIFFPSGSRALAVEPAGADDLQSAIKLAGQLQGEAAAAAVRHWVEAAPRAFRVVHDGSGALLAFSCVLQHGDVAPEHLEAEAATRTWQQHLQREPVAHGEQVLMMPRLLAAGPGEPARAAHAALVLDLKRLYLELRPRLRRLYCEVGPDTDAEPFLRPTGFRELTDHPVRWGALEHRSMLLDFGPGSVDGWLSRLVAASLREPSSPPVLLDGASRELVVDGQRIALTGREHDVLQYLMAHPGQAVKRGDLLDDIWGLHYEGGSNVIDVVVLALRKKLGLRASAIETVTRFGYRFRAP